MCSAWSAGPFQVSRSPDAIGYITHRHPRYFLFLVLLESLTAFTGHSMRTSHLNGNALFAQVDAPNRLVAQSLPPPLHKLPLRLAPPPLHLRLHSVLTPLQIGATCRRCPPPRGQLGFTVVFKGRADCFPPPRIRGVRNELSACILLACFRFFPLGLLGEGGRGRGVNAYTRSAHAHRSFTPVVLRGDEPRAQR